MSEAVCHKCKEVISHRIVTALGKSWHPEHFACRECNDKIEEPVFSEKDGEPVCSKCFLEKYSDVCYGCNCPIGGNVVKALGQTWHEEHFRCAGKCKSPLSGSAFYERDGKAYCKEDYEILFAAKCVGCSLPIMDKAIVALNAKWHRDCFRCKKCETAITSSTFAVEDDKPICASCVA